MARFEVAKGSGSPEGSVYGEPGWLYVDRTGPALYQKTGTGTTGWATVATTATVQPLDATLTALAGYNTDGLVTQTASDTFTGRTLTGDTEAVVTNGNGVSGNPTLSIGAAIARLASPTFTGTPSLPTGTTGTTQSAGDNSTKLATTGYVDTASGLLIPKSLVDAKGDLLAGTADNTVARLPVGTDGWVLTADAASTPGVKWAAAAGGAPSGSAGGDLTGTYPNPTVKSDVGLGGNPTAATQVADNSTTRIATTAFVLGQASASGDGTPAMDGTAARGTGTHFARNDHVHPTDTSLAPLASPTFSGTPSLPTGTTGVTQTAADSTTKLATTAFATTADNLKANLASPTFSGTPSLPTGTTGVTQSAGDSTTGLATTAFVTTADNLKANLASPTFSGTPSLPTGTTGTTQSAGDSSTKLATTAFVTTADNLKATLATTPQFASLSGDATPVVGTGFLDAATGLNIAVTNAVAVRFQFMVAWVANGTGTGARFSLNGPTITRLAYSVRWNTTATAITQSPLGTSYDQAFTVGTASDSTNNLAIIEGVFMPGASGTLALRCAAEIASPGSVTVKTGSSVMYW